MKDATRAGHGGLTFLFALLALPTLLVHGASAQGKGGPTRHDSAPARCRRDQLSVRRVSDDAAMGGFRSISYAFVNDSPSPCSLEGFPRFEVLNSAGSPVRGGRAREGLTATGDDSNTPPRSVTIEPGKSAAFVVHYNAGGAGRMRPCPAYRRVRITAPGTARGFVIREPLQLCGGLEVSPVGPPDAEGL